MDSACEGWGVGLDSISFLERGETSGPSVFAAPCFSLLKPIMNTGLEVRRPASSPHPKRYWPHDLEHFLSPHLASVFLLLKKGGQHR